jgi:tRNA G26 N,N-dimethylase Trm1
MTGPTVQGLKKVPFPLKMRLGAGEGSFPMGLKQVNGKGRATLYEERFESPPAGHIFTTPEQKTAIDLIAGSGARDIRIASELDLNRFVCNVLAFEIIQESLRMRRANQVELRCLLIRTQTNSIAC